MSLKIVPIVLILVPTRIKYPDRKCENHSGQIFLLILPKSDGSDGRRRVRWFCFNEFYSFGGDLEKMAVSGDYQSQKSHLKN